MQIRMRNAESLTHSQINEFLKGSAGIEFCGQSRAEVYGLVEKMLVNQEYHPATKEAARRNPGLPEQGRRAEPACRCRAADWAHAHTGKVEAKVYRRQRFAAKYRAADIALLAQVDGAHERLSGPATRCILKREYSEFGNQKFARLAEISVAHL